MAMISIDYTYNLPNEHCVDHEQTDGNTRTTTYDGPDKIFLVVENATGKEHMGPVTELERNDGRPVPEGCRYVEVDCITNPLVCQLRAPIIDEVEEDHDDSVKPTGVVEIDGYDAFEYQIPILPKDVYDPLDITIDADDNITLTKRSVMHAVMGVDGEARYPTYDDVRYKRAQLMKNSDSEIVDDMPADMKQMWLDYRDKLRQWPNVMEAANVPAIFAYNMEPIDPGMASDPTDGMYEM
jgi:hypothetical protein|tara:strand:+ start:2934 stop:3650 length:717 start_codon:yes stop_codon:yes gene_type:complete